MWVFKGSLILTVILIYIIIYQILCCLYNMLEPMADSHIACRAHAVPLPCRAAEGLESVFLI
jgi:hypothetical protein